MSIFAEFDPLGELSPFLNDEKSVFNCRTRSVVIDFDILIAAAEK